MKSSSEAGETAPAKVFHHLRAVPAEKSRAGEAVAVLKNLILLHMLPSIVEEFTGVAFRRSKDQFL